MHVSKLLVGHGLQNAFEVSLFEAVVEKNCFEMFLCDFVCVFEVGVFHLLKQLFLRLCKDLCDVGVTHGYQALDRVGHVEVKTVAEALPLELDIVQAEVPGEAEISAVRHVAEFSGKLVEAFPPDLAEHTRFRARPKPEIGCVHFDPDDPLGLAVLCILLKPQLRLRPRSHKHGMYLVLRLFINELSRIWHKWIGWRHT